MNLGDLVAKASAFASNVQQDPSRYASALKSGLDALTSARDAFEKLHASASSAAGPLPADAPAAEPPLVRELAEWRAIAETQEADAAVEAEIRHDQDAITAREVEDAVVTVVKIVGLVGKAL